MHHPLHTYYVMMLFRKNTTKILKKKIKKLIKMKNILFLLQNRETTEGGVTLRKSVYRKGLFHLMNETINPGILSKSATSPNFLSISHDFFFFSFFNAMTDFFYLFLFICFLLFFLFYYI